MRIITSLDDMKPREDRTGCKHEWGVAMKWGFMVDGKVDYECKLCNAHGWRQENEPEEAVR